MILGLFFFSELSRTFSVKKKAKICCFCFCEENNILCLSDSDKQLQIWLQIFFMLFSLYPNTLVFHFRFSFLFILLWRVLLRELLKKKKNNPTFFSRSRMRALSVTTTWMPTISSLPSFRFLLSGFFSITSWRGCRHLHFSCLCSLSHGFSVTPAVHLSALDEQNTDIPGLFQNINVPFGPCLTVFASRICELNLIASWLLLFSSALWVCGQAVLCFMRDTETGEDPNCFFSDHTREGKSNSTSLEHTALCQKVENLVLNLWASFSSFNKVKYQVTLNTCWEFGWYNGITVRMSAPKILCPSEKDY